MVSKVLRQALNDHKKDSYTLTGDFVFLCKIGYDIIYYYLSDKTENFIVESGKYNHQSLARITNIINYAVLLL